MKITSVNVSLPIEVEHRGKIVETGICKNPVDGSVHVNRLNLIGDRQADLVNHGGEDKAVYAYSLDHYAYWQDLLGRDSMPYGQFGENLTVAGLDESESCIGDHLQIGSTLMAITQPRVPCFKLGIRMENKEMPKLFSKSARTGFYLKVLAEGEVEAGDTIEIAQRGSGAISVRRLFEAFFHPGIHNAVDVLYQALDVPELSLEWRKQIEDRLKRRDDLEN
jgi:MOSC domain-containing protein YiiM